MSKAKLSTSNGEKFEPPTELAALRTMLDISFLAASIFGVLFWPVEPMGAGYASPNGFSAVGCC